MQSEPIAAWGGHCPRSSWQDGEAMTETDVTVAPVEGADTAVAATAGSCRSVSPMRRATTSRWCGPTRCRSSRSCTSSPMVPLRSASRPAASRLRPDERIDGGQRSHEEPDAAGRVRIGRGIRSRGAGYRPMPQHIVMSIALHSGAAHALRNRAVTRRNTTCSRLQVRRIRTSWRRRPPPVCRIAPKPRRWRTFGNRNVHAADRSRPITAGRPDTRTHGAAHQAGRRARSPRSGRRSVGTAGPRGRGSSDPGHGECRR